MMEYQSTSRLILFLVILDSEILQSFCLDTDEISGHLRDEAGTTLRFYTLGKLVESVNDLELNMTQDKNISLVIKRSQKGNNVEKEMNYVNEQTQAWIPDEPPRKLPLSIIITASGAAVGIMLFLCVAFYFHNAQLNKKAERLSMTLYVTPEPDMKEEIIDYRTTSNLPLLSKNGTSTLQNTCLPRNSSSPTMNVFPRNPSAQSISGFPRNTSSQNVNGFLPKDNSNLNIRSFRDYELLCQQRKSTISLGLPSKGSTLSAYTDQEIANQSAKRKHSVFIL